MQFVLINVLVQYIKTPMPTYVWRILPTVSHIDCTPTTVYL